MLLPVFSLLAAAAAAVETIYYDYNAYNDATFGSLPTNYFKSTDARTPQLQINIWNKSALDASGGSHIFLRHDGHSSGVASPAGDSGPLILRIEDMTAVYINRSFDATFNVRVQQDRGAAYLTYYGGPMSTIGLGDGYAHALDQSYRETYTVAAQHLTVKADIHEFTLTGDGTALVTAYELVPWDLTPFIAPVHVARPGMSGRMGYIKDSIFQEINLDTNEVLFEWRASQHIDMSDSFEGIANPLWGWDFFHINSVEKSKSGDYLVSARHMHAIYLINGTSGATIWTLGGKKNEFTELPAASNVDKSLLSFAWQHHASFYPGSSETEFTFFDNHVIDGDLTRTGYYNVASPEDYSRGVHFRLNTTDRTVQLLHEYVHPARLASVSQGSVQVLPNGNVFVGWGRNPSFTEHTPDGACVLDVQFSPWREVGRREEGLDNYRAFRGDWIGVPYWGPDIAAEQEQLEGDEEVVVVKAWVSWNGATEVRRWVLLASDSGEGLDGPEKVVAMADRHGFETAMVFTNARVGSEVSKVTHVRAAALNEAGDILGATGIVELSSGEVWTAEYPVTKVEWLEIDEEEELELDHQEGINEEGQEEEEEKIPAVESLAAFAMTANDETDTGLWTGMCLRMGGFVLAVWLFTRWSWF